VTHVVIIGASLAGTSCAQRLVENDADIKVTLISDEVDVAYDRPPLSKSLKLGETLPVVNLDPQERLKSERVSLLAGVAAESIEVAAKLVCVDGNNVSYDKLVIATGARARMLPPFEIEGAPVATLRTLDDAKKIQALLESKKAPRVGIVGGGFIGLELASALSESCQVDLFEAQENLLSRVLPKEISDRVAARHAEANVNIHMSAQITGVEGNPEQVKLTLADDQVFECDLVVLGVGAIPNDELASKAGLTIDNGIAVDETLRASDDVYAAGDCCSFPLALTGTRVRLESWRNAQEQGLHIADQILSGEHSAFGGLPWFWSDQYDLGLQMAGWPNSAAQRVIRDMGESLLCFELGQDSKLSAVSGIGPGNSVAKDIKICERLMAAGKVLSAEDLADSSVNLKKLMKG